MLRQKPPPGRAEASSGTGARFTLGLPWRVLAQRDHVDPLANKNLFFFFFLQTPLSIQKCRPSLFLGLNFSRVTMHEFRSYSRSHGCESEARVTREGAASARGPRLPGTYLAPTWRQRAGGEPGAAGQACDFATCQHPRRGTGSPRTNRGRHPDGVHRVIFLFRC